MTKYNLLDEKWLLVVTENGGEIEEISLKELFTNAHHYKQLAGETPTQDFAILRLLLAILHTVFTRFNAKGKAYEWVEVDAATFEVKDEIDEDDERDYKKDLYKAWKQLWETGKFPAIINEYLEKYRYRFYLTDEKYPFFQFPEIGEPDYPYNATDNGINKLNGKILEGDPKKPRLFMNQHLSTLEYSAAARWLVYANGYSPSKSGNPGKKLKRDSTGVAYLWKLGGIYASGKNLFETLMLNLNLPENACAQKPLWEVEPQINNFKDIPNNLAQLFTYPSRQLLLNYNEENQIIGYRIDLAISNFEYTPNLRIEPFTLWRYSKELEVKKWQVKEGFVPKRHNPDKYFWQEMQTFAMINEAGKNYNPGIIMWLQRLQGDNLVTGLITLHAVAENYIQKDGVVDQQISDQISENIGLLDDKTNGWLPRIADEINNTEKVIEVTIMRLAKDIDKIRNVTNGATTQQTKMQIFFLVDRYFRDWLISVLPEDDKEIKIAQWRIILRNAILAQANILLQGAGNRDYLGYYPDPNTKKIENIETAFNRFKRNLNKELEVKGNE